jgi:DnaK suppressor protein
LAAGEVKVATVMRSSEKKSGKKDATPANDTAVAGVPETDEVLDQDAPFMGESHQRYFRNKLLAWKASILEDVSGTREQLREGPIREPDATDRASSETDWSIELRRRDRQRKLVAKIDAALRRLDKGEYGYCLVTGEPISLARLDARPIATMTVEAQERHERNEKLTRED